MAIAGNEQHLRVKSFFAATVRKALQRAHEELGPDALLLNARETPPEARHLGVCEVVLGVAPETASGPVETLKATPPAGPRTGTVGSLTRQAAAAIATQVTVCSEVGRITALVGPPGAGKTTTLVKLAVQEGLRLGRSTCLISAGTHGIGGAEQLRTFAAILDVSFQAVERAAALAAAIDAAASCDLILIDTPGYSRVTKGDIGSDLADFLNRRQDIDKHLVLTASTQRLVLRKLIDAQRASGPSKLILTRLDEAVSLAPAYSEAVHQQMPLSYLGLGQSIPEDLERASRERITASLVTELPAPLQAVA